MVADIFDLTPTDKIAAKDRLWTNTGEIVL